MSSLRKAAKEKKEENVQLTLVYSSEVKQLELQVQDFLSVHRNNLLQLEMKQKLQN